MRFPVFLGLVSASALISTNTLAQEYLASTQQYSNNYNTGGVSLDNGIHYNYAEFGYVNTEIGNLDGDGFQLGASYKLSSDFYVKVNYSDLDYDFNIDSETLEFTGGFIFPYKDIDVATEFSLIDAEFGNSDDTGWMLSLGGRKLLNQLFEARVFLRHSDVLDNTDTTIELGGDYYIQGNIAVGVTVNVGGDTDRLSLGGRYFF